MNTDNWYPTFPTKKKRRKEQEELDRFLASLPTPVEPTTPDCQTNAAGAVRVEAESLIRYAEILNRDADKIATAPALKDAAELLERVIEGLSCHNPGVRGLMSLLGDIQGKRIGEARNETWPGHRP